MQKSIAWKSTGRSSPALAACKLICVSTTGTTPSSRRSRPSSRCGSPRPSTTSPARPSCTASASRRLARRRRRQSASGSSPRRVPRRGTLQRSQPFFHKKCKACIFQRRSSPPTSSFHTTHRWSKAAGSVRVYLAAPAARTRGLRDRAPDARPARPQAARFPGAECPRRQGPSNIHAVDARRTRRRRPASIKETSTV